MNSFRGTNQLSSHCPILGSKGEKILDVEKNEIENIKVMRAEKT